MCLLCDFDKLVENECLHMNFRILHIVLLICIISTYNYNYRGGGELGTSWHLGAVKHKKRKTIEVS